MAKRATSKKSAKKAAPAKKAPAKKAAAPKAKKAAPAKKAAAKKAAPAKKTAARKLKVAAPVKKASPPPKKAKPQAPVPKPKKKSPARRAAAAVKTVAKTAASVVMAPVKAVAAVVAGPVAENPPESGERREEESHEGSSNGVDAHADEEEEAHGEGGSDPESLIERLESAYNVTLPERYRRFLREGEYHRYPRIELAGYIRGPYEMDFLDDLLPDVAELGQNAGIYDMDDVPWGDDYRGFVPLASLSHPEVDEPKVFLVQQVGGDSHRVLLFDYEGWKLYPLADSFDSFLSNLPQATNDISTSFRPGDSA